MLLALKDDDENVCTPTESADVLHAAENYLQCSGMNAFFDSEELKSGELVQNIVADCQPVFDMAVREDIVNIQDDTEIDRLGKSCLQTLLGDNAIGNFIRYEYGNLDEIFGCFSKLGEELPHCVMSTPVDDEDVMSLPLSLMKKLDCVLGLSYESLIEDMCVNLYETFDECLPKGDEFV